jgi:hypothetical protein
VNRTERPWFGRRVAGKCPSKCPNRLPPILAAGATKDAETLALCLAKDAVMHDEGRDHRGRNAIQQWKREADTKFQYVLEPLDASVAGDTVRVRARLTGDLPGSPIELDHCRWRIPKESATSRDWSPCPELCEYAVARPESGLSGADSHLQLHWNPFSAQRGAAPSGSLVNRRCHAMKIRKDDYDLARRFHDTHTSHCSVDLRQSAGHGR